MGSACAGAAVPTLKDNLLNHFHMTGLMYYHSELADRATSAGIPYVIGETNSISVLPPPRSSNLLPPKRRAPTNAPPTVPRPNQHLRRLRRGALEHRLHSLRRRAECDAHVLPQRHPVPLFGLAACRRQWHDAVR